MPRISQPCADLLSDIGGYARKVGNLDDVVKAIKVECRPSKRGGKKRALSKYNLHMKSCLKERTGPIKSRFRNCVGDWRRKK